MPAGLSDEIRGKIRDVFTRHPPVGQTILYGSRAMGTHKAGSDIDITLVGKDLDLAKMNSIRNELDDLMMPHTFDLSNFSAIDNPDLVDHIQRAGQKIYP